MRIEVAVRSFENGKLRMLYVVVQKQSPSKCTKGELTHECPAKDTQVQQHGPYNYIFQFKQDRLVH